MTALSRQALTRLVVAAKPLLLATSATAAAFAQQSGATTNAPATSTAPTSTAPAAAAASKFQPLGIPTPGPVGDGAYAPQPILPGGVVVPLYAPDSPRLKREKVREAEKYGNGIHADGLKDRDGIPFGTWQDRYIDWFRDLGFLGKTGMETKAARDVAAFAKKSPLVGLAFILSGVPPPQPSP